VLVVFYTNHIFSQKDTISSKVIGKWALTSYTQCLNCLTPEVESAIPFKKRSMKINDKNGIYYFDFRKDSTVSIIFQSKKLVCEIEGKWSVHFNSINIKISDYHIRRYLGPEPDGGDPCRKIFCDPALKYGFSLNLVSETQIEVTETLYNCQPYGWSTYKKVKEIPLPKK